MGIGNWEQDTQAKFNVRLRKHFTGCTRSCDRIRSSDVRDFCALRFSFCFLVAPFLCFCSLSLFLRPLSHFLPYLMPKKSGNLKCCNSFFFLRDNLYVISVQQSVGSRIPCPGHAQLWLGELPVYPKNKLRRTQFETFFSLLGSYSLSIGAIVPLSTGRPRRRIELQLHEKLPRLERIWFFGL